MKAVRLLNLLTFVATVTVNALANILPINGVTTGDVSAKYENYFTPAGFTFTIWGLIYVTLFFLVIYQVADRVSQEKSLDEALGYSLVINFLANISWIFAWHHGRFTLTLLLMIVILVTLVIANERVSGFSWLVKFPLQLYMGWICVATIANVSVWLTYLGWDGWGVVGWYWGIAMVIVAGALAMVLALWRGYSIASLTIAWGIFGIYGKQVSIATGVQAYTQVCLVVIGAVVLATVIRVRKRLTEVVS